MGKEVYFPPVKAPLQRVYACGMWNVLVILIVKMSGSITVQLVSYVLGMNIYTSRGMLWLNESDIQFPCHSQVQDILLNLVFVIYFTIQWCPPEFLHLGLCQKGLLEFLLEWIFDVMSYNFINLITRIAFRLQSLQDYVVCWNYSKSLNMENIIGMSSFSQNSFLSFKSCKGRDTMC